MALPLGTPLIRKNEYVNWISWVYEVTVFSPLRVGVPPSIIVDVVTHNMIHLFLCHSLTSNTPVVFLAIVVVRLS